MRFLVDNALSPLVAEGLRQRVGQNSRRRILTHALGRVERSHPAHAAPPHSADYAKANLPYASSKLDHIFELFTRLFHVSIQNPMENLVLTNIAVYKQIADEAHKKMLEALEAGRRPKPDGSAGWVLTYDPNRTSFKHSMISIVFTGMWLEALMHQLIVKKYGKENYKDYDRLSYEDKLTKLGCCDELLLGRVKNFRDARKMWVHEKAYFDNNEFTTAQSEAENAHEILTAIHVHFLTN